MDTPANHPELMERLKLIESMIAEMRRNKANGAVHA